MRFERLDARVDSIAAGRVAKQTVVGTPTPAINAK
jgi:hypothetical protein